MDSAVDGNRPDRSPRPPNPQWRCRWCRSAAGTVVLDLGRQPAADYFPLPTDPEPDDRYQLRMVLCAECALAQLESDPTTADEPRGLEPRALALQADEAIEQCVRAGLLRVGDRVLEFGSPHGGSWMPNLEWRGMAAAAQGSGADLVLDCFGLMHHRDQRAALKDRIASLAPGGILLLQFHSLAAIMRNVTWNALRHGHFAYYSAPVLVQMVAEFGLHPVGGGEFDLYGGTVLVAFRAPDVAVGEAPEADPWVADLLARERADGVLDESVVGRLQVNMETGVTKVRSYLESSARAGLSVAGYGAASRAVALLQLAGDRRAIAWIADASPAKQGRALPGLRVPIVAPSVLAQDPPDRVLLFVPDLLDEVRAAIPEVEAAGGRWVVLEPDPREIEPVSSAPVSSAPVSGLPNFRQLRVVKQP